MREFAIINYDYRCEFVHRKSLITIIKANSHIVNRELRLSSIDCSLLAHSVGTSLIEKVEDFMVLEKKMVCSARNCAYLRGHNNPLKYRPWLSKMSNAWGYQKMTLRICNSCSGTQVTHVTLDTY